MRKEHETVLGAGAGGPGKTAAREVIIATCALRKAGEFWTVGYPGALFHIKDSKGLAYIAHLLRNPGVEFHVLDLARDVAGDAQSTALNKSAVAPISDGLRTGSHSALGDAGDLLDAESKAAYRRRLSELREMTDEARERGDVDRVASAEEEIEALSRELSRAVGKRGRQRRAASAPERARVAVTKAIKSAIDKIDHCDHTLARLLQQSIKTGTFCVYEQGASTAIRWDFGAHDFSSASIAAPSPADSQDNHIALSAEEITPARRTEFVGRDAERKQIAAALAAALAGHGSVVLISGGAGVGKTRLAIESARGAANPGAVVLIGRCYEAREPHPYIPFVEMIETALSRAPSSEEFRAALGENAPELAQLVPRLRRVFPDIQDPLNLPPQQLQRYLFDSVHQFLARSTQNRPIFLILDDLHWADDATLALLSHLSRGIADIAAAIICTYRDTKADMGPSLIQTLEELIRDGVRPVSLEGLPQPAVADMIAAICGKRPASDLVEAVYYETGGNPFFVEELTKCLLEEGRLLDASGGFRKGFSPGDFAVPQSVDLVVGRRLDRLSESTREKLASAAIIGRRFDFELLETIVESDGNALLTAIDEALKAGVVASTSTGKAPLSFAHEIVRQSILRRISPPRLQRLHLRAARAMAAMHPESPDEYAAEIADHLIAAGSLAGALEVAGYLVRAGRRATFSSAYSDALHFFETALPMLPEGESALRAELLFDLGMTKRSLDRWEEALVHWRESLNYYGAAGDLAAVGRLSFAIVEALSWAGRYFDASQVAHSALTQLGDVVSTDRARLLGAVGMINSGAGVYQAAHDALAEAAHLAEQLGDQTAIGIVLSYRAFHNFIFLDLDLAIAEGKRSSDLLRAGGALWSLAQILGFLETAMFEAGRITDARAVASELEPLATRLGHSAARMLTVRVGAWCEFLARPDLNVLDKAFASDLEITQSARLPWIATSYAQLGFVNFLRGNWQRALDFCEQAAAAEFPSAFDGFGAGALFRQRAYMDDRSGALELMDQRKARLPRLGTRSPIGAWGLLLMLVEGLYVVGERERAAELYPLALEAASTGVVCMTLISRFPHTVAGIAAAAGKQWQLAESHFKNAIASAESMPHPLEQYEVRRFYGQMLIERGDPAKGRSMLSEALRGYEQIGMRAHAALTRVLVER